VLGDGTDTLQDGPVSGLNRSAIVSGVLSTGCLLARVSQTTRSSRPA